jgi:predicted amidophosphoribosyltransferase
VGCIGDDGTRGGIDRRGDAPGGVARPVGFPGCRLCPYRWAERPDVCLDCLGASTGQVAPPGRRRCSSCEQVLRVPGPCPTHWCGRADRGWSVVFAAGVHAGGLRRAIVRYKYGGERWWAGVFGRILAGYLDRRGSWLEDFDALVPMPAYTGAGARRRWDPVAEIVRSVAAIVGPAWSVEADLIRKVAETRPMSGRSRGERAGTAARQLRAALEVPDRRPIAGARLLVVDDVLAEGSTLREVALALRRAGAAEVAGLVLARPDWQGTAPPGSLGRPAPAATPGAPRRDGADREP